jgi:hypothetical protein
MVRCCRPHIRRPSQDEQVARLLALQAGLGNQAVQQQPVSR